MHYENNIEDLCWYEVGNRRFYNKIHAVLDHIQTKEKITFNVNDEEYSRFNWSIEPTQTLEELYAERARQLRDKYDYIVLHFSGGSDSCNILETFINNKLHIDEIITRGSYKFSSGNTGILAADDMYSEVLNQGLPLAQWAKDNHLPHMKISVVETSQMVHDYFAKTPNWVEQGSRLGPGAIIRANHDLICPHWRTLADSGKKIAHLYGAEKPRIFRHKNYFYTKWLDATLYEFNTPRLEHDQHPQFIECFYLGKHAIPLQIKQLHAVKNYIKENNIDDEVYKDIGSRPYDNFIAPIIYKRTLPLICLHLKDPGTSIIHTKDSWFSKDINSDSYKNWLRGVDYLKTMVPKEFLSSRGDLMNFWSKPHYLGT